MSRIRCSSAEISLKLVTLKDDVPVEHQLEDFKCQIPLQQQLFDFVDKYGFNSPESRGVFAIFIIGTVIGTIFISFLVTFSLSFLPLHPYAYAMASGVGSASMNAAAIGPTLAAFPGMETQIEAFAGFSNLLSFCVGIYIVIFIALPLTERVYNWLEPKIGKDPVIPKKEEE